MGVYQNSFFPFAYEYTLGSLCYHLLEVQTSDHTGWFLSQDVGSFDELVEIQTIYSHIQEIEPSSLISELTQDALYRLLPPGVRSCIRAYSIIWKWLISKIVAPRVGLHSRQARMELLIQAIEVYRLRNTEIPSTSQLINQPCEVICGGGDDLCSSEHGESITPSCMARCGPQSW